MNTGDTAWLLASSALVLLMTPGLAFFYGGMVRSKTVLNMMMMSFIALAIVPVLWVLYGYSMSFSPNGNRWLGGWDRLGLDHIGQGTLYGTIPEYVFVAFQLMFAIITVALISGAIADRAKFGSWAVFIVIWMTVVYFPVAHWVFDFGDTGGWIATKLKAFDFAGGTAVHINAGAAGLALALVLGKRVGWKRDPMRPHNLPFVLLGSGLLWFGWFGFNAGSAVGANGLAGLAYVNTAVSTAAAMLGWLAVEVLRDSKATSLGAASGAVAGLVAITPACGTVSPVGSIALGIIAGILCALAVGLKYKLGFDDSLDVVGVHLVGGIAGTLLIGLFATKTNAGGKAAAGLFYGGDLSQLGKQAVAVVAVLAYSFILTYIIGTLIQKTIGFRIDEESEVIGIDQVEHLETAYDYAGSSTGGSTLTKEH
ncbi:MAG: ammonium transporter, Amt family [Nocardioidaceae bacterium]|nr:ammonium transporter, Amt family [Nocardioidaceae bacterium]